MLQNIIPVTQIAVGIVLSLIMFFTLVIKPYRRGLQKWVRLGMLLGIVTSFAVEFLEISTGIIEREIYEGLVLGFTLVGEITLLILLWLNKRRNIKTQGNIYKWLVFLVTAALLYRIQELFLYPARFFDPYDILIPISPLLNTELMIKFASYFIGLGLALLTSIAVVRVVVEVSSKALKILTAAGFVVVMVQQAVVLTQIMLVRGIIPMSDWLLDIMIPLINYKDWFYFSLLAIIAVAPLILLWRRQTVQEEGLNPAEYRKVRATSRMQLRWNTIAVLSLALVFALSTMGNAYANSEIKLSPPTPVTVENGVISISVDSVADGKLHRYGYGATNGTEVRFIIIRKGSGAYGVGLDACAICGASGYYDRKGAVVCELCDVVINAATIGFKGGCNPVPLESKVVEGKIVIQAENLEKVKEIFQ